MGLFILKKIRFPTNISTTDEDQDELTLCQQVDIENFSPIICDVEGDK